MFCPECGYENNNENKFCMKCGKNIGQKTEEFKKDNSNDIPEDKTTEIESGVCSKCGYHNNISRSTCIKCGKQLKSVSSVYQVLPTNSCTKPTNSSYSQPNAEPDVILITHQHVDIIQSLPVMLIIVSADKLQIT